MLYLPDSLMNRLVKPNLLFSNFVESLYFRRIHFSDYLVCFTVILKLLVHGFLQELRQNGVGRVFERVNMMQENN